MSFRDEMRDLDRQHRYAFDQRQVENCASELHQMIKRDLKAAVARGEFVALGLFGQKKAVQCAFPFRKVSQSSPQTPYVGTNPYSSFGGPGILFYDYKEIKPLMRAIKDRCSKDGIDVKERKIAVDDSTELRVEAVFILGK